MKSLALYIITSLVFALCLFSFQQEPTTMSLQDAIKKKIISYTVNSNGNYSGKSVDLHLTNTSVQNIKISVPAGTVFIPKDEADQNLLIPEEELIVLNGKAKQNKVLNGYCIEASNHAPTAMAPMTISTVSNPKMIKLLAYFKGKKWDAPTYQSALWAVSDNRSVSNIQNQTADGKALRKFLCGLTGQKETWYHTPQNHTVTPTREIQSAPFKISGKVDFTSDGSTKMALAVYKANGDLIHRFEDRAYPKKGKVESEFSLKVEGWDKGNYEVRILNGETVVKKFPFTL